MREDFIHYLWKFSKLNLQKLQTVHNEPIQIIHTGQHNMNSGPDFFNAQLRIDDQLWAGNVEMHIKSSDWYVHNHEKDKNYDNVILHVVWKHDVEIYRKNNTIIPTLELEGIIDENVYKNYKNLLLRETKWINCEQDFPGLSDFKFSNWLERIYIERLTQKSNEIEILLQNTNHDWEAVLFQMLAKGFGLKLNSHLFFEAATKINFSIIRKVSASQIQLEALLFGIFGMLQEEGVEEPYYELLQKEFTYLKHKFELKLNHKETLHFFRTRPANFPTIRASQLATVYYLHKNLFSKLIEATTTKQLYEVLQVCTSVFWETHYTFGKVSPKRKKEVSLKFIDVLIINVIIPIKYAYAAYKGIDEIEKILALLTAIKPEQNKIIDKFSNTNIAIANAMDTQGLLELKKSYCDQQKCLQCAIGNVLLESHKSP